MKVQHQGYNLSKDKNGDVSMEKPDGPIPRLFISKIVVDNFKSYYGKRDIGPFHKCYSAVVGPNGSGKSNVIDAIVFCFGKRAAKMRLKRLAELIHQSDKHKDCEYAKVTIHFQDIIDTSEEGYEIVENSHFTLSRTVKKDSTTKYEINGKQVKYHIVKQLLLRKGVDLTHERYLILQGEVEKISLLKPKGLTPNEVGLLEYLEEIIGSDVYIQDIDEFQKKDSELSDNVSLHLNRLKTTEKARDELEKDKAQAIMHVQKQIAVLVIDAKNIIYKYMLIQEI
eukprot:UN06858